MPRRLESVSNAATGSPPRWILVVPLALIGSGLFITAYPPGNLGLATGWFALVPLMVAVAFHESRRHREVRCVTVPISGSRDVLLPARLFPFRRAPFFFLPHAAPSGEVAH